MKRIVLYCKSDTCIAHRSGIWYLGHCKDCPACVVKFEDVDEEFKDVDEEVSE